MKKPLVIVLIIAVVGAAGVWTYHFVSAKNEQDAERAVMMSAQRSLYCSECKAVTTATLAEIEKMPKQGDKYQCPKCKKFAAILGGQSPKGMVAP